MIIKKEQKPRPVELVKKYPKYECLKFDTLGQAARFLGVKSSYLKSYLDDGVDTWVSTDIISMSRKKQENRKT